MATIKELKIMPTIFGESRVWSPKFVLDVTKYYLTICDLGNFPKKMHWIQDIIGGES